MDIANALTTDDRLFDYLVNQFLQRFIFKEDVNKQKINDSTVKDAAVILGLITIAGTEPFKLLLRKNIGKLSLSMPRLAICCFLYLVWAAFIYALLNTESFENSDMPSFWFNPNALWVAAITYTILPLGLMILGFVERRKASNNISDQAVLVYRGDSNFFATLILKGADPDKVWGTHEPLAGFLFSLALTALNPFIGLPLLGTSISFWVNEIFHANNIGGCKDEKLKLALKHIAMTQNKQNGKNDFPTVN